MTQSPWKNSTFPGFLSRRVGEGEQETEGWDELPACYSRLVSLRSVTLGTAATYLLQAGEPSPLQGADRRGRGVGCGAHLSARAAEHATCGACHAWSVWCRRAPRDACCPCSSHCCALWPNLRPPGLADEESALAPLRVARGLRELRLPDGALSGVPDVVARFPQLTLLSFRGAPRGRRQRSLRLSTFVRLSVFVRRRRCRAGSATVPLQPYLVWVFIVLETPPVSPPSAHSCRCLRPPPSTPRL